MGLLGVARRLPARKDTLYTQYMPWVAQRVQNGLSFVHLTFAWLQASHDARSFCVPVEVVLLVVVLVVVVEMGTEGLDIVVG